ncbi:NUDIX domain-containing protein [Paenibacillus sp. PK1-4R]|uniref:NUDIX hydrolase n=1 Tax=Paenibacillus sp. PK1-4R TaxID=3049075 RepID=UPI0025A064F8|nr:NUDIX domain-containing protein [Paenibacillus sp. PK1-4R]WJM07087.1 NUDIX domain-containing protein [Paenibacillus sp. PK1-4R]
MENKMVNVVKGLIENEGKVLIVKRSLVDEVGAGSWETVGGKVHFGEELEVALVREIREEVGIKVQIDELLFANTFFTDPHRQVILLMYLCRTKDHQVNLSEEHSEYMWATRSELYHYLPFEVTSNMEKYNVFDKIELID